MEIVHLDSLGLHRTGRVVAAVRFYLASEYRVRKVHALRVLRRVGCPAHEEPKRGRGPEPTPAAVWHL